MKVIFLDRDGVINEFPGNGNYVTRVKDFHFIPGSLDAIRMMTDAGYKLFVISNQAGVGKGIFSHDKLTRITRKMFQGVNKNGGHIEKVYYATSRSEQGCEFRKPGIGFIREALQSMNKTIRSARGTYFIGDTESDMLAGHNAGCKTIFVLSGRDKRKDTKDWLVQPDMVAKNLLDAARIILENEKGRAVLRRKPPSVKAVA